MSEKYFISTKAKEDCSHNSKNAIKLTYEEREYAKMEDFDLLIKNLENLQWMNEFQKQIVLENIEKCYKSTQHSSKVAISMFEEAKKENLLKVTCVTVPIDILPPNYSCTLYDIKISSNKSDDIIYKENKWIRDNVTRGMNFMELTRREENFFDFAIYANKKFMGENGDENDYLDELDINKMCEKFFLDSPMNATEVICMTKLDGEVGHFSVRKIGEEYYIIAGSKNVHILYKTYSDIEKYTESRFTVAKEVSKAVLDIFNKMDKSKRRILEHFLNTTKSTVVLEFLKPHHQQIINLSHLKKSTIYGLMMTSLPGEEGTNNSLTTIPPNTCLEYFKFFGIPTPDYYSISVNDVKENINKMRKLKQVEGFVLYYLIKERTIGLTKVKTTWYVIVRAIREKSEYNFSKRKKKPLPDRINELKTHLDKIQKWLGFCDKCLDKWKDLGEAFLYWISQEMEKYKNIPKNNRPEFNEKWKEFVENCHKDIYFCCSDL